MTQTPTDTKSDDGKQGLAGKFLTFSLGSEEYGITILQVKEIVGIMEITGVPNMPFYMKGVVNLRGRVIPIMDLRLKFSMPAQEYDARTCIIVAEINKGGSAGLVGIVVDSVSEVLNFTDEEIEPPPSLSTADNNNYILAMAKRNTQVKILLDIDKVINTDDIVNLEQAA